MIKITLLTTLLVLCYSASYSQEIELLELRDMYSKTYQLESGEKQTWISGAPAHYFNGFAWEDIDPTLTSTATSLYNTTNAITSVFPNQPATNSVIGFTIDGQSIELSLKKEVVIFSTTITVLSSLDHWEQAESTEDQIRYVDNNTRAEDRYQILNGQVKNDLLFQASPNAASAENVYYGFREKLTLPSGWRL